MAVTEAELGEYVSDPGESGKGYRVKCVARAGVLLAGYIGAVTVPEEIRDLALLEVAADIFHRKTTRNGVAGFGDMELAPIRISRDPLAAAYPILDNYVVRGIG